MECLWQKKKKKSLFLSRKNNTHKSDSRQWDKSQYGPIHMCLNLTQFVKQRMKLLFLIIC